MHTLAHVAMGAAVIAAVLIAISAWRLSRGPVDLPWLTHRIEAAVNEPGGPTALSIGSTALAWEGFSQGVDRPLDLRLTDVRITGAGGRRQVDLPRAAVSLSIRALLRGRFEPRAVEVDGARVTLRRTAEGATTVDLGPLTEAMDSAAAQSETADDPFRVAALLKEFVRPATSDRGRGRGMLGQLQRVRVDDASLNVIDRQLGAVWSAPHAQLDLTRRAAGGVDGTAVLALALGDQTATLTAAATLDSGGTRTHIRMRMTPVAPAALARVAPRLSGLSALDAPVGVEASLDLGPSLQLESGRLTAHAGSGSLSVGASRVPLQQATFVLQGTPDLVTLEAADIAVLGHEGGVPTVVHASGTLRRAPGRYDAALTLGLNQVAFADLSRLWPEGTGGGARPWIVGNITTGVAHDGHVSIALAANEDLTDVSVTQASGSLEGEGVTVHWLRPVPPIENGTARLRIVDPDTVEIAVSSGLERIGKSGLVLKAGDMRITGLSKPDQVAAIRADISGPLADAIALLKEPRLELLDRHPIDMRDPAGNATVALTVDLPLDTKVQMNDVTIHAVSHLTAVHLGGIVAGRDLDQGILDLDATSDGLSVKGRAEIAGIAAQLDGAMDFRPGPPAQVVQRVVASGRPGAGQLAAAGLDPNGTILGEVPLKAAYTQHRAGNAEIAVEADFTPCTLAVPPLDWRKPIGVPATGTATVVLNKNRLVGIDRIAIDGSGIDIQGSARAAGGQIVAVQVDRAVFGRNDLRGSVRMQEGQPIEVDLSGSSIDLGPRLTAKSPRKDKTAGEPPPGPSWSLSGRLAKVWLAGDRVASAVTARIENDGRVTRMLHVTGQTGGTAPFVADIAPRAGGRQVAVTAADAGALLRGLDVVRTMDSGTLTIKGNYDDEAPGHPLIGTADIESFRVRGATGLAKLLQAMTLYGLVDVLRGPGIGFTHLIAPFRYDDDLLTLNDARAFSPSLGLTAKGRIDLNAERVDVEGTIVPAYFFNSLLGNLPLVGKLFSPEQGGGVFAARYTLRGKLDDPTVSVNALSALTPGFLREIFGLF